MEEPLRKTLKDESPYVRKTAAICVAKLFDLNPTMCIDNGFLETLQELLGDSNSMVVANAVTALVEIQETSPETKALQITPATLKKMLMALSECTEWGRVTILTTLADYKAHDLKESEHICERVVPQFQHVNPSVVLAAVKVVFLHMQYIGAELRQTYQKKMAPPLGWSTVCVLLDHKLTDSSHTRLISARSPVCSPSEYRSLVTTTTRYPESRDASILLQIQRSTISETTEDRDYGADSKRQEHGTIAS